MISVVNKKSVDKIRKECQEKMMQCVFKDSVPRPHKVATQKSHIGSTVCEEFHQLSPVLLLH